MHPRQVSERQAGPARKGLAPPPAHNIGDAPFPVRSDFVHRAISNWPERAWARDCFVRT